MRPRVRTNTLTGYAELARSLGLDPAAMMAGVGLDPTDLDVADDWIPAGPVARLLQVSAEVSGHEDFGLRMAGLRRLGTLGPLAVVLREEPDLRSVLDVLVRYQSVYNQALHLHTEETGEATSVWAWLDLGEPVPHDQALDLVVSALVGIIRTLVSPDWVPLSASFSRPAPEDARPWQDLFGMVEFGRRSTGLVFPTADLQAPVVASDSSLRPYTQQFLRSTVAGPPDGAWSAPELVAKTLELLLPLGRHSIGQVSRRLGVGPRALQRQLAHQGESFSSVLHATRGRLAERYLTDDRYSLTELSQMVGFGAPSAFTRWFHDQFGSSPTEWRRKLRAGLPPGKRADAAERQPGSGDGSPD